MKIMALDYETTGLDFWDKDFRVLSCALTWRGDEGLKSLFVREEEAVGVLVRSYIEQGYKFIVHNMSFEWGVSKYRYGIDLPIEADTMRLVQVRGAPSKFIGGKVVPMFGLEKAVNHLLPEQYHNFKQPYYEKLRSMGYDKPGEHLDKLPEDMFQGYNTADTEMTYLLYEAIVDCFGTLGYNWRPDHELYKPMSIATTLAKANGVPVDRKKLQANIDLSYTDLAKIDQDFRDSYPEEVAKVEEWVESKCKLKTEAARTRHREAGKFRFKPNSTTQLGYLFQSVMDVQPTFLTEKGAPSFKDSHLYTYGKAGEMLAGRGSLRLKIKQMENLLELSNNSKGLWRHDIQVVRTATGRLAGGSGGKGTQKAKLNVQGLSRRFQPLMEAMVAKEGHTLVSVDLSAGEPTATAHYSQDENYRYTTFDGVGKSPFWANGILMIDDIYLMGASVSPTGRDAIQRAWDEGIFEQWVQDPEAVKANKLIKPVRGSHKGQILGISYGMGPKKMVAQAREAGIDLSYEDAKEFWQLYWFKVFPKVRRFGDALTKQYENLGHLVNVFGFRLQPDSPHKCLNYYIQSTISGIINYMWMRWVQECPYVELLAPIHDELLVSIPTEALAEAKHSIEQVVVPELNKALNWTTTIRSGWIEGNNWHQAK